MGVVSEANSMLMPFSPQHLEDLTWEKIEESRASVPVTKAVIETGSILIVVGYFFICFDHLSLHTHLTLHS